MFKKQSKQRTELLKSYIKSLKDDVSINNLKRVITESGIKGTSIQVADLRPLETRLFVLKQLVKEIKNEPVYKNKRACELYHKSLEILRERDRAVNTPMHYKTGNEWETVYALIELVIFDYGKCYHVTNSSRNELECNPVQCSKDIVRGFFELAEYIERNND